MRCFTMLFLACLIASFGAAFAQSQTYDFPIQPAELCSVTVFPAGPNSVTVAAIPLKPECVGKNIAVAVTALTGTLPITYAGKSSIAGSIIGGAKGAVVGLNPGVYLTAGDSGSRERNVLLIGKSLPAEFASLPFAKDVDHPVFCCYGGIEYFVKAAGPTLAVYYQFDDNGVPKMVGIEAFGQNGAFAGNKAIAFFPGNDPARSLEKKFDSGAPVYAHLFDLVSGYAADYLVYDPAKIGR